MRPTQRSKLTLAKVRTNPLLHPGWQLIDGATGAIVIAEADAARVMRSWSELERQWQEEQR
jgi:hypothetical protein